MSSVVRETSHPVDAMMIEYEVKNIQRKRGDTYMVETIIVGITRNGKTSKMKRESNQAVGLAKDGDQENLVRITKMCLAYL